MGNQTFLYVYFIRIVKATEQNKKDVPINFEIYRRYRRFDYRCENERKKIFVFTYLVAVLFIVMNAHGKINK